MNGPLQSATVKVTLDPKGAMLENDLHLIVRDGAGNERHGNMGLAARFDRVNNFEQVHWTDISPETVTILISASRVTLSSQPYAVAQQTSWAY